MWSARRAPQRSRVAAGRDVTGPPACPRRACRSPPPGGSSSSLCLLQRWRKLLRRSRHDPRPRRRPPGALAALGPPPRCDGGSRRGGLEPRPVDRAAADPLPPAGSAFRPRRLVRSSSLCPRSGSPCSGPTPRCAGTPPGTWASSSPTSGSSSATTPSTPVIDPRTWRLRVFGSGLRGQPDRDHAVELDLGDLRRLPRRTVTAAIECAGNGRRFYGAQQGTPATGTAWSLGGIGVARWTGVPLRAVLERAGRHRPGGGRDARGARRAGRRERP